MRDDGPDWAEVEARAAALNRRPIALRAAAAAAGGYEERAVKEVLRLTGSSAALADIVRASREATGKACVSFAAFGERFGAFPVNLRASRLRFDYNGIFMELMNDFEGTPMMSAWGDAASGLEGDRPLGLVFAWPKVKGCKNFCVFHDAMTGSWSGTRVSRDVGGRVFSIETLPSFLGGLGVLDGNAGG